VLENPPLRLVRAATAAAGPPWEGGSEHIWPVPLDTRLLYSRGRGSPVWWGIGIIPRTPQVPRCWRSTLRRKYVMHFGSTVIVESDEFAAH